MVVTTTIEQDQGVAIDCDVHREISVRRSIISLLPTGFAGREISLLRALPQRVFLSFSRPEARRMVLL